MTVVVTHIDSEWWLGKREKIFQENELGFDFISGFQGELYV